MMGAAALVERRILQVDSDSIKMYAKKKKSDIMRC